MSKLQIQPRVQGRWLGLSDLKTREEDEGILPQTTIQSFQNSFLVDLWHKFTNSALQPGCVFKKHDENLKIIKTCIDLSHFSGIDTGFFGRFADSAPTTLMIWEKLILLRENLAAS